VHAFLDTGRPCLYYGPRMTTTKGSRPAAPPAEGKGEWKHAGRSAVSMYGNFFFWLFREPFPSRQVGQQIVRVMLEAFGVLMVSAVVEGGLFAWLAGWYGRKFSIINWGGAASSYLLLTEATTMIGAMIFAARIGTAFTVEIGSMQMSGQLDALRLMAVEPVQYIVIPRVLASVLSLVLLKAVSDGVAVGSAMLATRWWFDISFQIFLQHAFQILAHPILTTSYVRCAILAFFIAVNGCGLGFYFSGGAIELGRTTTKSIVINLICVIAIDSIYGVVDSITGWSVL
jgi:phospholipid/cholesterol/gamma-HCH transport system permease protein